jgi:hypothetical protein
LVLAVLAVHQVIKALLAQILYLEVSLLLAVAMVVMVLAEEALEVLVALQVVLQPQDREMLAALLRLAAMAEEEEVALEVQVLHL